MSNSTALYSHTPLFGLLTRLEKDRLRLSRIVAIAIIIVPCCLLLWKSHETNFLDCSMECGETLLAVRSADLFRENGVEFGLLENMGNLAQPNIYTHHANNAGCLLIAP